MATILNKERILEQARTYIEEGRYDKAIVEYEKLLVADPSDLRVKLRIAELYTKRKETNEAIRIYREVANSYATEEFYLKAVTVLKNILRLNPTLMDVNMMLAELYEKMGLIHDAVRQYDILATTIDQKGDFQKTIDIHKKIVELTPNLVSTRIKLAEVLQREGKTDEAMAQYEEIAKIYEAKDTDDHKLAEIYEKIIAHKKNVDMLRVLFRIYSKLGDNKKIIRLSEGAKDLIATDPEILRIQAKVYLSLNQLETAKNKYLFVADLELEKENVKGALEAYADIMLNIPHEEEKVLKKIKDLNSEDMFANIFKTKKEEKIRKEAVEEKAREEILKHEKVEVKKADNKNDKQKTAGLPIQTSHREIKNVSAHKSDADTIFDKAEVVYNLGRAYLKMDLSNEAEIELNKAGDLYKEVIRLDGKYKGNAKKRLNDISKLLSGEVVEEKWEKKEETMPLKKETFEKIDETRALPKEKVAEVLNKEENKVTPKVDEKKDSKDNKNSKKKKISFV